MIAAKHPWNTMMLLVIACELSLLGWFLVSMPSDEPAVSLESLEPSTAEQLRIVEANVDADSAADWLSLASVYRAFGLLPAADYCYRRSDALGQLDASGQFGWGLTLSRLGQTQLAAPIIATARRRGFVPPAACDLLLANDRLREEDVDGARKKLQSMENSVVAGIRLARLLIREQEPAAALQRLTPLLAQAPEELRLHQLAAWAHAQLGNQSQAEQHRLIAVYCRDWTPRNDLSHQEDMQVRSRFGSDLARSKASKLIAQGETRDGIDLLATVLESTGDEMVAIQIAQLHLQEGRSDDAMQVLRSSVKRIGPSAEALNLMGQIALARGDADAAVQFWERGLDLGANRNRMTNIALLRSLMTQSSDRGEVDAATRYRGLLSFQMGKFVLEQGNLSNARQQFAITVREIADHAPAWFYLGEIASRSGDLVAAAHAYQQCLRANPHHGRAAQALARITR